ncbi:MAG: OmpA family protein [Spirochaetes bacterium]|nr:OmpA family protein [Spirochaetota bacterium]
MNISVKIYNGSMIKVFDTKKDKKKEVILTPVKDNQKEAEVEFFAEDKRIDTLLFKNLPPAKARVLNLPVKIELVEEGHISIKYKGLNNKIEKHDLKFKKHEEDYKKEMAKIAKTKKAEQRKELFSDISKLFKSKNFYKASGLAALFFIIIFLLVLLIMNFDRVKSFSGNLFTSTTEKPIEKKEEIIEDKKTEAEEIKKEELVKKYTKDTLLKIINDNSPIYFIVDQAEFLDGEETKIENIYNYLINYNKLHLIINGHTQSIGLEQNEMNLSIKRSEYVKKIFEDNLAGKNFIYKTVGYGSTEPAIPEASGNMKYKNRRVEIEVVEAEGIE